MNIDRFWHDFKQVNGIQLTKDVALFRRPVLEVYDLEKGETIAEGKKLEELLDVMVEDKPVRQYIEELPAIQFYLD